jgi:hypothetical protein
VLSPIGTAAEVLQQCLELFLTKFLHLIGLHLKVGLRHKNHIAQKLTAAETLL